MNESTLAVRRQRICMEDVITGQEFSRSTNMPARWLVDQVCLGIETTCQSPCNTRGTCATVHYDHVCTVAGKARSLFVHGSGAVTDYRAWTAPLNACNLETCSFQVHMDPFNHTNAGAGEGGTFHQPRRGHHRCFMVPTKTRIEFLLLPP